MVSLLRAVRLMAISLCKFPPEPGEDVLKVQSFPSLKERRGVAQKHDRVVSDAHILFAALWKEHHPILFSAAL